MRNRYRLWLGSYRLDRAYGWSRWRSFWRAFDPGEKLLEPPGKGPWGRRNRRNVCGEYPYS